MSITKKYLINGPITIARLTNEDNTKILYIMGDIPAHITNETQCQYNDDYDAYDIDKFLLLFMKTNKKKEIDLFLNTDVKTFIPEKNYYFKDNYITSVLNLFKYYLVTDKKEIRINPKYPYFRFHYSNIFNKIKNFDSIFYFYNDNIEKKNEQLVYTTIPGILNISLIYNELKNLFIDTKESFATDSTILKILNNYNNKKTKEIINNIFNTNVINGINDIIILIDDLINTATKNTETINYNKMKDIDEMSVNIFRTITDLFFIRRFLDKNYIKTSILYTNINNYINIIYYLVKYFNFNITHMFNQFNLDKINHFIRDYTSNKKYTHIIDFSQKFISNNVISEIQCCNMFDFPDDFS